MFLILHVVPLHLIFLMDTLLVTSRDYVLCGFNSHQMVGTRLAHMVLHLPHVDGGFGVTFNDVTKDAVFYTTTSRVVSWLGVSPRNVRSCGCPRMIFGTCPHGHRPRLYSFVTSTPSLLPSTTTTRSVRRLSHRSTQGLVIEIPPRMVFRSRSRFPPSQSHNSTDSMRLPLCGMRPLPPTLLFLSFRHSTGSPFRCSVIVIPSGTSNLCLWSYL
jgi:hypothetical protein